MSDIYWSKQADRPLFEDLLWSKPENKRHAGKLLVIGGNAHGFLAPGNAYAVAVTSGVGTAKVLLPDALKKTLGSSIESALFAPSTKSGGFAKSALAEWLDSTAWADGVLLAGDLGRNSETAILIEQFIKRTDQNIIITQDALDYFNHQPKLLFERQQTTVVASVAQLQKLVSNAQFPLAITFETPLKKMVEILHVFTTQYPVQIIIKHNNVFFVAVNGDVSTTATEKDFNIWRVQTATTAGIWLIQNPEKPFEALTTAIYELVNNTK
jgi:ADP-dependent NAD(P)H-hydrate dehydratase / NAD(P)H-hydrate epimerase